MPIDTPSLALSVAWQADNALRLLRERIDLLERRVAALEHPEASFPCGCQTPSQCFYDGGGGILTEGVHCKRQPMARGTRSSAL